MSGKIVGASLETLSHASREHSRLQGCPNDAPGEDRFCPCGQTVAIVCLHCEEPVFLAIAPEATELCEHAKELL